MVIGGLVPLMLLARSAISQTGPQNTRLSLDHVLALEDITRVDFSPDASNVVVEVRQAPDSLHPSVPELAGLDREAIWLFDRTTRSLHRFSPEDGAGYWDAQWSPHGETLGALSTRGGDNIRLVVGDRTSGDWKSPVDRGVDVNLFLTFDGTRVTDKHAFAWLNDTTVLCGLLRAGHTTFLLNGVALGHQAFTKGWQVQGQGESSSAVVLETGTQTDRPVPDTADLAMVNARTGAITVLAAYPVLPQGRRRVVISPSDHNFSLFVPLRYFERPAAPSMPPTAQDSGAVRLAVISRLTPGTARWFSVGAWVDPSSMRFPVSWMRTDSVEVLCFLSRRAASGAVYAVDPRQDRVRRLTAAGWNVSRLTWSTRGQLLFAARVLTKNVSTSTASAKPRDDWWRLDRPSETSEPTSLTGVFPNPPEHLVELRGQRGYAAAVDDTLWMIDAVSSRRRAIHLPVASMDVDFASGSASGDTLLIESRDSTGRRTSCIVAVRSHGVNFVVVRPLNGLHIEAFGTGGAGSFLLRPDDIYRREPVALVCAAICDRQDTVIVLNRWYKDIRTGARRLLAYTDLDGKGAKALMILPIDYHEGVRYPLITVAWSQFTAQDTVSVLNTVVDAWLDPSLLTGRGYAVLIPAMNYSDGLRVGDPAHRYESAILPAVDSAIRIGVADSTRLGIMGFSFGGYMALSVITTTQRFQAAAILAPATDLISFYDQIVPRYASESYPGPGILLERGTQFMLGRAPWDDPAKYAEITPIFHLNRVTTPTLIMAGDDDNAAEQGEEVFAGLSRLGRPVRFVRYIGESHILQSPANIRSYWDELDSWFRRWIGHP